MKARANETFSCEPMKHTPGSKIFETVQKTFSHPPAHPPPLISLCCFGRLMPLSVVPTRPICGVVLHSGGGRALC